jgi:MFS family permease
VRGAFGPSIVARIGIGRFLTASALIAAAGLALLLRFPATSTYPLLGVVLFVVGMGTTSAAFAATVAGSAGVSDDEQGLSSALINAARQVGAALGVAILLSVAAASTQGRTSTAALADGYRTAMGVTAGLALVAAVISARLLRQRTAHGRFGFGATRGRNGNGSTRSRDVGERADRPHPARLGRDVRPVAEMMPE